MARYELVKTKKYTAQNVLAQDRLFHLSVSILSICIHIAESWIQVFKSRFGDFFVSFLFRNQFLFNMDELGEDILNEEEVIVS